VPLPHLLSGQNHVQGLEKCFFEPCTCVGLVVEQEI